MNEKRKAGPLTMALGLIVLGGIVLVSNITGMGIMAGVLKYWPILLIGLGLEYFFRLWSNRGKETEETRFHIPTLFLILFLCGIGFLAQQIDYVFKNNDLSGYISEALGGTNYNYQRDFASESVDVPNGGNLKVNVGRGSLDLVPSPDAKVHVGARIIGWGPSSEEAQRRAESVKINFDQGSQVRVSYIPDRTENVRRQTDVELQVMVPKGVDVTVESETGLISGGDLQANLDITSTMGTVRLDGIKGEVTCAASNGSIEFKNIEGNLHASSEFGSVSIADVSGNIQADSESGQIEITSSRPVSANYSVTGRHGQVILRIPEDSDAKVSATSAQGRISGSLGLPVEQNQGPGMQGSLTLGSGKGAVTVYNDGEIILDRY